MDIMPAQAPTHTRPPEHLGSALLLWLIWILWLPLFIPNIIALAQARPPAPLLVVSILGAVAFFALYFWVSWRSARAFAAPVPRVYPEGWALWAPVAALVGLAISLTLVDGYNWGTLLIYTASGVAGWLPPKKAAVVVLGLVLFIGITLGLEGRFAEAISPMAFVGIVGAIVIAFGWSFTNIQQLRTVREELARAAAINEERLRIARDLHDLLGHNLSLIALKSELAHRLIAVAPERAATEIGDIERVARTALQEVREAVTNYRTPTLASELHKVPAIMEAAGIRYRMEGDERPLDNLPAPVEAALSWAVREGVTNVIRHSRARQCIIRLSHEPTSARVEVIDDGIGPAVAADGSTPGNGLRGLAERVAALGGRVETGPDAGAGFRLAVWVPTQPSALNTDDAGMESSIADARATRGESGSTLASHEGDMAR